MSETTVKIINRSHHPLPAYETPNSAGMDVRAYLPDGPVVLAPMERALIPTGLYMQLPMGLQCEVRPRSGLSLKHGLTVLNSPGTVDADYRGEIRVILANLGTDPFTVSDGERIAQLVIMPYVKARWEPVDEIDRTVRGDGGFGHTGVN